MVIIERYAAMRAFGTQTWSIGDRALANEIGPRVVAEGLTEQAARAEVERLNLAYTATRHGRVA